MKFNYCLELKYNNVNQKTITFIEKTKPPSGETKINKGNAQFMWVI